MAAITWACFKWDGTIEDGKWVFHGTTHHDELVTEFEEQNSAVGRPFRCISIEDPHPGEFKTGDNNGT